MLKGPKGKKVVHRGKPTRSGVRLIIAVRAQKVLGRGYEGYLCNSVWTETHETSLENISGSVGVSQCVSERNSKHANAWRIIILYISYTEIHPHLSRPYRMAS